MNPDFEFKSLIKGKVINIVPEKGDKPAVLQFFGAIKTEDGEKFQIVDVKVNGAKKSDLEKFLNKKVLLDDVKVFSADYGNKFYRLEDISLISIIDEMKKG